jgi:hypothetical protein
MAGSAFGAAAHHLYPSLPVAASARGLIGMGALLGAATGHPTGTYTVSTDRSTPGAITESPSATTHDEE